MLAISISIDLSVEERTASSIASVNEASLKPF